MGSAPFHKVRNALKVELLISGTYKVNGDRISISAQVVDLESSRVIKTIDVEGSKNNVLQLRRNLSDQLAVYLTKYSDLGEPLRISNSRPSPWSESVDAMRALYEGIDLFDNGRYSEAWLKFRQAEKENPQFADAQYWAARMDYFQNRYQHSRLEYEEFLERYPTHPQVGEAIREYIHTFEKTTDDTEKLLYLYQKSAATHPDALHQIEGRKYLNSNWTKWRSMRLLAEEGKLEQALAMVPVDKNAYNHTPGDHWRRVYTKRFAEANHNPKLFDEIEKKSTWMEVLKFLPGQTTITNNYRWKTNNNISAHYLLVAPEGKLFDSLKVWPVMSKGHHSVVQVSITQVKTADVYVTDCEKPPISESRVKGFAVESLAEVPFLTLNLVAFSGKKPYDPEVSLDGMKVEAVFKDIPEEWGTLKIISTNCDDFRVLEGDNFLRSGCGNVYYLKPGKHQLHFKPMSRQFWPDRFKLNTEIVYKAFDREVEIVAGEAKTIEIEFPWAEPDRWEGWKTASVESANAPKLDLELKTQLRDHSPCFLMEDDRIRLIWSEAGNLWTCESEDGINFINRRALDLPISSAWTETQPRCQVDHRGRYVLTFLSDRNDDQVARLYMAWSRDFQSWTSPRRVRDRFVTNYDIIADPKTGKLLIAEAADDKITVWEPDDYLRWSKRATVQFEDSMRKVRLLPPNKDGYYEIVAVQHGQHTTGPIKRVFGPKKHHISRWLSRDLENWTEDKPYKTLIRLDSRFSIEALRYKDGKTLAAQFGTSGTDFRSVRTQFLWYDEKDALHRSKRVSSVASHDSTMAWHPKWGAYLGWFSAASNKEHRPVGPLIIRGPDFSPFLQHPLTNSKEWGKN